MFSLNLWTKKLKYFSFGYYILIIEDAQSESKWEEENESNLLIKE